ncbi:hypothetical protein L9F63_022934, partial [Diploptera punctata]
CDSLNENVKFTDYRENEKIFVRSALQLNGRNTVKCDCCRDRCQDGVVFFCSVCHAFTEDNHSPNCLCLAEKVLESQFREIAKLRVHAAYCATEAIHNAKLGEKTQ